MVSVSDTELPPPPRSLRRRAGYGIGPAFGRWFIRLFILPHTLAGVWMIYAAVVTTVVQMFGADVPGTITDLRVTHGRNNRPTYSVHYSYRSGDEERTGSTTAPADVYDQLQVGQEYPVRVLPPCSKSFDQPRGPGSSEGKAIGHWLVAAFWNAILSLFLWRAWIAPWRIRNLLREGLPTPGTIVGKSIRRGTKGGMNHVIEYEFLAPAEDDPDGMRQQRYTGATETAEKLYEFAEVGKTITVLYYPGRPRRNIAYECAEYEAIAD